MNNLALSNDNILEENEKFVDSSLKLFRKKNSIVKKPLSFLSASMGLTVEELYNKFIPLISEEKDIRELALYADMGIEILQFTDKNVWRSDLPEQYFFVLDRVVGAVKEVGKQKEGWLKRKALKMHMRLTDVQAEKRRFIEQVVIEDKLKEIENCIKKQKELENEIIDI